MPARSRKQPEWSARADRDLFDAWLYIAANSILAADAVTRRIIEAAENLLPYPRIGRSGRVSGTRELPVGHTQFTLVYRVRGNRVSIARILHQRLKYP